VGETGPKLRALAETQKQRELTADEKKEAARLFNKVILEDDVAPSDANAGELLQAEKEKLRQQVQQQPDSPGKTRILRLWELVDKRNQRVLTAEEKTELLHLLIPEGLQEYLD
jgi:uncharacterized protein YnzC (UPF0291/DUF896 family)